MIIDVLGMTCLYIAIFYCFRNFFFPIKSSNLEEIELSHDEKQKIKNLIELQKMKTKIFKTIGVTNLKKMFTSKKEEEDKHVKELDKL